VRRHLTRRYGQRWMGRGRPVPWPSRSHDLNPVDYCVWGHVKSLVYISAIDTVEELHHRIEGACQKIRNEPGVFETQCGEVYNGAYRCKDSILNTFFDTM
jgi:hypothetical protein